MFDDTDRTIKEASQGIYKEKGSRFLSFVYPVNNEAEVKANLQELRKTYYDARHHCYAYALGPNREAYRINDDGEPSGTAGKPIYGQILSTDITNVLIVVVRYFGGTRLGVRGLIDAYRSAANYALTSNQIIEKIVTEVYEIDFEYTLMNDVMKIIKDHNLLIINNYFEENCKLQFGIRKSIADQIVTSFNFLNGLTIQYKYTH